MFGGDKNKKLLKAVEENDLEKVKKYLGKGANLETRNNVWDRNFVSPVLFNERFFSRYA